MSDAESLKSLDLPSSESEGAVHELKYECELSPLHVDPLILPKIPALIPGEKFLQNQNWYEKTEDRSGMMAEWINGTILQIPGGVDIARDVDDGGATMSRTAAKMFTRWVPVKEGSPVFARFSQARTAMHDSLRGANLDGGALRTPVEGGVALEFTTNPESTDPRVAVTQIIYQFSRQEDANYPWVKARGGRIYDLSIFTTEPFFAGPLYNGHPNEITDPQQLEKARSAAIQILRRTVQEYSPLV